MTTETLDDAVDEIAAQPARRKVSGKRLVLFAILPMLMLAGGGGALYVTGVFESLFGGGEEAGEEIVVEHEYTPGVYHDLPDILVNLSNAGRQQSVLRLSVSLELSSESVRADVDALLPRIIDNFQIYLRGLTLNDVRGSAGLHRLREELFRRVAAEMPDHAVRDVLFREMLVQ